MIAGTEALRRVLVVEDDLSWQAIVTEILVDMGLAVDAADCLDAATECLRGASHRLAVVDLSLGGADHHNQDGLIVLDAIRRQDPNCVSILLTGFATVELAVSALTEHGALSCLRKEVFRRAELRKLVDQALLTASLPAPEATGSEAVRADTVATLQHDTPADLALVVEDDAGWRDILAELLLETGVQPRLCASYGEALGQLRREKFSLAIVDLSLASSVSPVGNQDGYRILANTQTATIPTIVVSGAAAPADIDRAYAEFGIYAYLEKQKFDRRTFRRTVRDVLAVRRGSSSEFAVLTEREREVLELLARGLTNKEMAATLVITTNTVKRHLKSIFDKLEVHTRAGAVAKVPR